MPLKCGEQKKGNQDNTKSLSMTRGFLLVSKTLPGYPTLGVHNYFL